MFSIADLEYNPLLLRPEKLPIKDFAQLV
jgi:hypothetical protein